MMMMLMMNMSLDVIERCCCGVSLDVFSGRRRIQSSFRRRRRSQQTLTGVTTRSWVHEPLGGARINLGLIIRRSMQMSGGWSVVLCWTHEAVVEPVTQMMMLRRTVKSSSLMSHSERPGRRRRVVRVDVHHFWRRPRARLYGNRCKQRPATSRICRHDVIVTSTLWPPQLLWKRPAGAQCACGLWCTHCLLYDNDRIVVLVER